MHAHPDDPLNIADCRNHAARTVSGVDLARVWTAIEAEIWAPPTGLAERLARSVLRSPGLARALVTTPSLVLSWIVASIVVLAAGMLATESSGTPWVALLAPALAGIGVSYAYGPGTDPAFELTQSMAISDRTLLLVRALAVFGLYSALGLSASAFTSATIGLTLGWLIPMTTVSALGLAVAGLTRSANGGVAAALAGWSIVVLAGATTTGDVAAAVDVKALLPMYLVATVVLLGLALYATSGRRTERLQW